MKAFNILQHCKPINITNGHFIVHFIAHILIHTNTIWNLEILVPRFCNIWTKTAWQSTEELGQNTHPFEIIKLVQKPLQNDSLDLDWVETHTAN